MNFFRSERDLQTSQAKQTNEHPPEPSITSKIANTNDPKTSSSSAPRLHKMQRRTGPNYTFEEKVVLRLLWDRYPDPADFQRRTDLFNRIFEEEHGAAGLSKGRDSHSLKSCWANRYRSGREKAWNPVMKGPLAGAEQQWEDLKERVRVAVAAMGGDEEQQMDDEDRVPQDPAHAQTGDTLCGGCDRNITKHGLDSYQCTQCAQSGYCSECYAKPGVLKCHPHQQFARQTSAERTQLEVDSDAQAQGASDVEVDGDSDDKGDGGDMMDLVDTNVPAPPHYDDSSSRAGSPQPTAAPSATDTYTEEPLEMIHKSEIVWASDTPYWTPGKDGQMPIPHNTEVYLAGGKVHRVTISGRSDKDNLRTGDYMVCTNCPDCGTDNAPFKDADVCLPFVHTADTMRHPYGLLFDPITRPKFDRQNSPYSSARLYNVIYGDGKPRVTAVCIVRQCFCYNDALLRGNWEEQAAMD